MIIVYLALAALAVLLVLVARQPNEFRVTRSLLISAPAEKIFPFVNRKMDWQFWSPWVALDPAAKYTFEGPDEGVGAITRWEGKKSGAGSSTLVECTPPSRLVFRLDFLRPFKATNTTEFTFVPEGDATRVIWSMHGKNSFIGKLMGLVFNCEKMVGAQFDQGLRNLKALAETP